MGEKEQYQAPPQQQAQPVQEQPKQRHHSGAGKAFKGLARKFGDSVMFGAGATLGSDFMRKLGG